MEATREELLRKKLLQKYIEEKKWGHVRYALKIMMMCQTSQRNAEECGGPGEGGGSGDDPTSKPLTKIQLGSDEEISALKGIANNVLSSN